MAAVNLENSPEPSIWETTVEQRLKLMNEALKENEEINSQLPGLRQVLTDSIKSDQNEEFFRNFIKLFDQPELGTYETVMEKFPEPEQKIVLDFVDGTALADLPEIDRVVGVIDLDSASEDNGDIDSHRTRSWLSEPFRDDPFVKDLRQFLTQSGGNNEEVQIHKNETFKNWGNMRNVEYTPSYTCVPSTLRGVQAIVKAAKGQNWGVRCAGYRHSWAPIFGRSETAGQVLVSLLPIKHVTSKVDLTSLGICLPPTNELRKIEVKGEVGELDNGNTLVRVGAGVTNEELRRWCLQNGRVTLPLNVIMVEITVGGANAPICHGAGIENKTLSDLVRKIEYVDCHGQPRTVNDEEELRAAAGCFGLIGVVTHLTLEFKPMSIARMQPEKLPVIHAVPPPDGWLEEDIPIALRLPVTAEQREADIRQFESHCENDYYAEWFWFPYHDQVWVNCWNTIPQVANVQSFPGPYKAAKQIVTQSLLNMLQSTPALKELFRLPKVTGGLITLLSKVAMDSLPNEPIETYLPEALHFQRGIQNLRVLDLEVEIPIPGKKDKPTARDLNVVRKAWWDAIRECYQATENTPQQMPLEMRIMGDSDVIMAPQRGNKLGTCSIEILTLDAARGTWNPYAQRVLNRWMSYTDSNGDLLATRPHWAKQWTEFTVRGELWRKKLRRDYETQIREFRGLLRQIGKRDQWTLADLEQRFSNDLLDHLFFTGRTEEE
ncbi:hypothetical protein N5P37_007678 [Trichoderma harzianum]|nr:hypothetical protein N5P37_007678 [Trichoderma harzianum]